MTDQETRVAIVTGGGRGIGAAAADALAADGVAVAVVARTAEQVERVANGIRATGGTATGLVGDVADPEQVDEVVAAVAREFGTPCEILVNAAGVSGPIDELADVDVAAWSHVVDVNLTGAFAMCRAVLPAMRERGRGRIVNLSSGLAHRVQPGMGPYSVTKAALSQMSRVLDAENKRYGVRVFAVEPGLVRTEMSEYLMAIDGDGVHAAVRRMLHDMRRNPGLVAPTESARLIRLVATGRADDLAGQACSIYDQAVRARLNGSVEAS